MTISQQDIIDQLTAIKNRDKTNVTPQAFVNFQPKMLPNMPVLPDESGIQQRQQAILDKARTQTDIAAVEAQNRADYAKLVDAQKAAKSAKHYLSNSAGIGTGGTINVPGGKFKDNTPFNIKSGIATYNWRGRKLTVNRSEANNFIGFLNALTKEGYKVKSLGSYANRNIAGTNTKSLHSLGLAIDINPAQNPVSYGHIVTNLPRNVSQLAARYGLMWGGAWHGPKFDTMHFSRPYGGRE